MNRPTSPTGGLPAIWPRAVPFVAFIALLALDPLLGPLVEGWLDPRWLYAFRSSVTAVILVVLAGRYQELRGPLAGGRAGWAAALLVGLAVFGLWIALDFPPLTVGTPEGFDPRVDGRIHWGFALTRLGGAALVVPVMEELFWRSFILRWLEHPRFLDVDPRRVGWKALILSSLVFAAEHHLWFAGLLAGLAYGELYRRTGDLRVPILAHAVTNGALGLWVLRTGAWGFW